MPLAQQFSSDPIINQILRKFLDLQFEVFCCIVFKEPFGVLINYGWTLKTATLSEFDVLTVAQQKSLALNMLQDGFRHYIRELGHIQVFRHKAHRINMLYVLHKNPASALCKFEYLNQQFRDVISCC